LNMDVNNAELKKSFTKKEMYLHYGNPFPPLSKRIRIQ